MTMESAAMRETRESKVAVELFISVCDKNKGAMYSYG